MGLDSDGWGLDSDGWGLDSDGWGLDRLDDIVMDGEWAVSVSADLLAEQACQTDRSDAASAYIWARRYIYLSNDSDVGQSPKAVAWWGVPRDLCL